MDKQEFEKAIKKVRENKKQQFIESFESGKREKTELSTEKRDDDVYDFFYGVPVLEKGKLKGFKMMTFTKVYGGEEVGFGGYHTAPDKEYKNENGSSFMSVDEYLEFYKKHLSDDAIKKDELRDCQEANILILGTSKLAEIRKKAAKVTDKVAKAAKVDGIVKKITGGKKVEDVKINKGVKAVEKAISDMILGRKGIE